MSRISLIFRKDFQFKYVEAQDPYKITIDDWKKELESHNGTSRPEFVLINSPTLTDKFSDRMPSVEEFEKVLKTTGEYVQTLKSRKVHLLLTDIKDQSQM